MAKNRNYEDGIFTIGTQGNIRTEALANGGIHHVGEVATALGYVVVTAWQLSNGVRYTNLEIIRDGEVYVRHYDEYFRPRTLVQLANQFAGDVFNDRIKLEQDNGN